MISSQQDQQLTIETAGTGRIAPVSDRMREWDQVAYSISITIR